LQRPLPDSTQQTQQIDTHVPGGIRSRKLSIGGTADLLLRPSGHRDRLTKY